MHPFVGTLLAPSAPHRGPVGTVELSSTCNRKMVHLSFHRDSCFLHSTKFTHSGNVNHPEHSIPVPHLPLHRVTRECRLKSGAHRHLPCVHPLHKDCGVLPDPPFCATWGLPGNDTLARRTPSPVLPVGATGPELQGCQVSKQLRVWCKSCPCRYGIQCPESQVAPDSLPHHRTAPEHWGQVSSKHTH